MEEIVVFLTMSVLIVGAIGMSLIISRHRLKVHQIKADAMVRAEEIRAKNQIEIERLLSQDQTKSRVRTDTYDETYYERKEKGRERA